MYTRRLTIDAARDRVFEAIATPAGSRPEADAQMVSGRSDRG
jgi:hypothetical protein